MAFSGLTDRGTANTKVSGATLAVSPTANITVGKIAFAYFVTNNLATTSGDSTNHSMADTDGHTWTKVFERTRTQAGAALDGVTHSLWWTKVTSQIDTGDSVTGTISSATTSKAISVFEVSIGSGTIRLPTSGTAIAFQETSATSATASTASMPAGEKLHLGMMGHETDALLWTEDADYTNIYTAEGFGTTGGGAATNVVGHGGYRIASLTADTFAVSWTGATDIALALVAFEEFGDQTLTGALFTSTPTFFVGAANIAGGSQTLNGTLFTAGSTFFAGSVYRNVPTGLVLNEIGVLGHSSVGTFIDWYRTLSSQDLLTQISHGGLHTQIWGDPADPGYAAAWAKLDDDQPVGGYRAFWVMLGFLDSYTETQAEREAWIDHIGARILTDFPTIEYIWWSPMTSMFDDDAIGLDGDAADLVALDPWGANPSSLTVWTGAGLVQSVEWSWEATVYALANGYADDYGPWINLHQSITDTDNRHPSEAAGGDPPPNGQTHGGDILLAFFENIQGMAGTLFVSTATFAVGTVTPGAVDLAGSLLSSAASFFTGVLTLDQPLTGTLFVKAPTFFIGLILSTVEQTPDATVSNDGWDTAPTPGQPIHTYLAADDSDYITVTV